MSEQADALIAQGNRAEDAGRLAEATALYREALRLAPRYAKAHLNLGIALHAAGDDAGALACYESALALDAANPYASYNLGRLRYERGAAPEAERLLRQALRAKPQFAEARIVLACALDAQGKAEAAAAELEAALGERPRDFGALFLYAGVQRRLGRMDAAAAALRRALAVDPASVEARATLFHVLDALGDLEGAARELEEVLRLRPDWPEALYNYGCALKKLMRPAEAEDALRRALAAEPRFARAYRMLGAVLLSQARIGEALALYRSAPEDLELASAELFALNASQDITEGELFARHAAFGRRLEEAHPARFASFVGKKDPDRRLRIGYVSGDFAYHVVTLFLLPVLERHDRAAFEVVCYSTAERVDEYTRKLAAHADAWRACGGLGERALADAIHADAIDILVDLAGHSGEPQLRVFAQRPAPVQATWLGYLNTTGLTRIDYRISDAHCDPTDARHTETLVRLPHSQWCYRPFIRTPAASAPPCTRSGYVTFGSFNQTLKLSKTSRRLWAQILSRVPDARLVVLGVPPGRAQQDLLADFDPARVTIVPYVSLQDYYGWFDAVDIALDTTPYSGGTTTFDALWMGVPVLTAPGERPSSRSAASILATAGRGDWIAEDPDDYVRRAARFAGDCPMLADLRKTLRARMQASPLMDEAGFTRDLEDAYRRMWRQYCTQG
jgi:predicted O-linked N-acetylglucosamine transferase (SPINDLY family)